MPDFQGNERIIVQPRSDKVPYRFEFTVCSASGANDGGMPFGESITSYTLTALKHGVTETDATTDLIDSHSRSGQYITAYLQYPSTNGAGRYKLRFVVTSTPGSAVMEFDFGRIIVQDR